MTSTTRFNIVAGPSREELFDALRLRHEGREVTFTVAPNMQAIMPEYQRSNHVLKVQVNELGIEDGSGNNWLFKIYDRNATLGYRVLHGYINVTKRGGWMEAC